MAEMYERLKQLREENNYSQEQVADYLEIDQSYISKIEKVYSFIFILLINSYSDAF